MPIETTIAERLRLAAAELSSTSDSPMLDAELLMAHALGVKRAVLLANRNAPYEPSAFEGFLARRKRHEPVAYILGEWEFYGLPLAIRPPMLVPRPETEHLVETTLDFFAGREKEPLRLLDLCTGSGCVAMALAEQLPHAELVAVDLNPQAVALARENLARFGERVRVVEADLLAALGAGEITFDAIVSNPPYVPEGEWETLARDITDHEDRAALVAGADGLDLIRRIVGEATRWLKPGGLLALEMAEDQGPAVAALMQEAGFHHVQIHKDLAGRNRIARGVCVASPYLRKI